MKVKILYLSYNGMMEPLGASQVLSYLYKISSDYKYYLISLEKPDDLKNLDALNSLKLKLKENGIILLPLAYKTDKTRKMLNFIRFSISAKNIIKKENIKFIHRRSYFPAITAYWLKRKYQIKYLFDTRGFAFDERADVGSINRNGFLFKLLKQFEKKLYMNASGINKLSHLGKETILKNKLFQGGNKIENIEVIPTCVDLDRFEFHERTYRKPITIGYVGTAIGWYDFDKTLKTLSIIGKVIDFRFLIFNGSQHEYIQRKVQEWDIDIQKIKIEKVLFSEMPEKLKEIDIALFYIHPFFSKRASAATKLAELFASGIPVLTNAGVGDHEYYIENYKTGKILNFSQIDKYDFKEIIVSLLNVETSKNCRYVAEQYFSLDKGVEKYKKMYKEIFK